MWLKTGRPLLSIERLTSASFLKNNLTVSGLREEIARAPESVTECEIIAKYCLNVEQAWELITCLNNGKSMKFSQISTKIVSKTLQDSDLSDLVRMEYIMVHGTNEDFVACLKRLNMLLIQVHEKGLPNPDSVVRILPVVETEIVRRKPVEIDVVIDSISRLKLANVTVFQTVIESLMSEKSKLDALRPSLALSFLRELGWAGYTHSGFKEKVSPLFSSFRNYQAVTSVMIIAGGLTPAIVESCMKIFRSDLTLNRGRYALDPDSASQLIRRLVVCGFFSEAMEVFESFPEKSFLRMNKRNSISQIHRLFAASFIAPDIVCPSKVSGLRQLSAKSELTSVCSYAAASSFIHNLVVNALNRLGVDHVSEFVDQESLLMIDIFVPSLQLAIEVQGPSHYLTDLASGSRRLRPEDEFKLSVLRKRGYKVEQLSVFDFGRNHATRNADDRIREILQTHGLSCSS